MKAPSRWTERFEYGGERGTSQELFLQIVILFTIRKLYDEALERKKCIDNCWLSCIHGADKAVAIFSRIKLTRLDRRKHSAEALNCPGLSAPSVRKGQAERCCASSASTTELAN